MTGPTAATTPDGMRLHLNHGPIDLIIEVSGDEAVRVRAHTRATQRFATILDELVAELDLLRRPLDSILPQSPVGRRMSIAVESFPETFITPMAAVAGAVADEILASVTEREAGEEIERAFVNNGGDIALHLGPGARFDVGLVPDPRIPSVVGKMVVTSNDPVRGIATSGRHGRSLSLGIADSVTVLAHNAAAADAAATIVANAVDLPGHHGVERVAAGELDPDTDLGERMVTTKVAALSDHEVERALTAGARLADTLVSDGRIAAAALALAGRIVRVGDPAGVGGPALGSGAQRSNIL